MSVMASRIVGEPNSHSLSARSAPQIRGASAFNSPASTSYQVFASILDTGLGFSAFFAGFIIFGSLPTLSFFTLIGLIAFTGTFWASQKFFLGITLGERIWALRSKSRFTLKPELVQCLPVSSTTQSIGSFLTLFSFFAASLLSYFAISTHPIGMRAQALEWEAFFPPAAESDRWAVMPFFYSLGAWPRSFKGKPIFFNLPYEKGPPLRFAGEITARLDPQTRLTFEGPKSPLTAAKEPYDRADVQRCVSHLWDSLTHLPHCLSVRSAVLSRHIDALKRIKPNQWEIKWVSVTNRAIASQEQLQGIYLSARNDRRGQDRFVMLTPRGTHQTFILDYPSNEAGYAAREDFKNAMRSQRVSDELAPGRVWVDQSLEKIDLRDITKLGESEEAIQKLAEVQAFLIARISVDPKTYDTYFHLAGTAMMLGRTAIKLRGLPPPQGNPERAAEVLDVAKPTVLTAQKYAQDVDPQEKRNALLQKFWAESQKF